MKWTCEQIRSRFHAHLEGNMDREEADGLEIHLRECANCRETLELERELFRMAALEPVDARAADLADAVLATWETEGRIDRLGRTRARCGTALSGFAFRALIDPLLWADYQVRHALTEARLRVLAPLRAARLHLAAEIEKVGRTITSPLAAAYRLATRPLTGRVY